MAPQAIAAREQCPGLWSSPTISATLEPEANELIAGASGQPQIGGDIAASGVGDGVGVVEKTSADGVQILNCKRSKLSAVFVDSKSPWCVVHSKADLMSGRK